MRSGSHPRRILGLTLIALALVSGLIAQESEAPATAESEQPVPAGGKVLVGKIDGEINLTTSAYVKRLIDTATETEAAVLILELNTFGGRVDAAVLIRDALIDAPMHTAVFINKRAISAGALISLACNSIAIGPGGTIGAATPVSSGPGQEVPAAVEEKYLSYFRQEMRSTAETRGRNGDIAEAMVDAETEVPGISEKGKLLTLNTKTAIEHAIADVEASSVEDALEKLGLDGPTENLETTWAEGLAGFFTSQAIASLLFLGMMVLGYLELQTPGIGIFGGGALICALLLYFSHYLVNLAGFEELLLFALGVLLVVIELFALPGFGLLGLLGLSCMLASSVLMLLAGDWSDFTFSNPFALDAVVRVSALLALTVIVMALLVRYATFDVRSPLGRRLILADGLDAAAGFESHERASDLVDRAGTAITPLRPTGKARIDGQRWNVETEGDFIDAGATIRVLRQEAGRIVVRGAREV
ncbi:MAG: NfeD family protein [Acidobacteriota bacterium]